MKRFGILGMVVLLIGSVAFGTVELKKDTQVVVRIGPILDVTDGITPEVDFDLTTADEVYILKAAGAAAVDANALTFTDVVDCNGWYDMTITSGFPSVVGDMTVVIQDDSICLPLWQTFRVVTANWYDSKYGSDELHTDAVEFSSSPTAANNVEDFFANATAYGTFDDAYDGTKISVADFFSDAATDSTTAEAVWEDVNAVSAETVWEDPNASSASSSAIADAVLDEVVTDHDSTAWTLGWVIRQIFNFTR